MRRKHRRRWVERGKTLLIILLSVSALALVSQSPLVQGSGLLSDGKAEGTVSAAAPSSLTTAAIPVRIAVGNELGLYGVQYDQENVDALFDQAGPLLGEALSAAQARSSLSRAQWRTLLSGPCVYFDFSCPIPLSALCSWLKEGPASRELTDSARHILLATEEDGTLSLCYQSGEDGGFYRSPTTLDASLHLSPITESVTPNGAFFAFEDAMLPDVVASFTLFTSEDIRVFDYHSATPPILTDAGQTAQLLAALSFSDQNRASVSDGILYVDGQDTLRLSADGQEICYDASGSGKYAAGEGLTGAVDAAWCLAEATLGALCGDARLYLISAHGSEDEDAYTVTFGYALNGCSVYLYDQGWAAQFQVRDGYVSKFTLRPRTYLSTGHPALLLPADKAAAALTALTNEPKELVIQYRDGGGSTISPSWVGR